MAYCRVGALSVEVHAWDLLKEVTIIFITSTIVWPQVKQQGGNRALPINRSEVAQSSPTLCDPVDCNLSDSSVHGIFQARVLEWIAISFSRGSSRPRNWTRVSHIAGRRFTCLSHQGSPSTENGIKDLLRMALPFRTRSSFPLSLSLPSGSFHKPLIHQRADRMKTTITEN